MSVGEALRIVSDGGDESAGGEVEHTVTTVGPYSLLNSLKWLPSAMHVKRPSRVGAHKSVKFLRRVWRIFRGSAGLGVPRSTISLAGQNARWEVVYGDSRAATACRSEVADDASSDSDSMFVVAGQVIRGTALLRVHLTTSEVLLVDNLAHCGFHQR